MMHQIKELQWDISSRKAQLAEFIQTAAQPVRNLYGFELIVRGLMKGAYYHTDFQKYRPELCKLLRRRDVMFSTRPSGFYGMVSKKSSPGTTEDTQRRASPDLNLSSTIEKPDESK
jgi:hypothetical protein